MPPGLLGSCMTMPKPRWAAAENPGDRKVFDVEVGHNSLI